jgi:hypothetical protein
VNKQGGYEQRAYTTPDGWPGTLRVPTEGDNHPAFAPDIGVDPKAPPPSPHSHFPLVQLMTGIEGSHNPRMAHISDHLKTRGKGPGEFSAESPGPTEGVTGRRISRFDWKLIRN